jgi:osmotically-inducible protein OsmY
LALLFVMLLAATACQTTTGRSAGQWTEDKATTARVKTALGATKVSTLTRVDVDTVDGIVYLRGKVESPDVKQRAGEVASNVTGGRVVNDLIVDPTVAGEPARDTTPAASPTTR